MSVCRAVAWRGEDKAVRVNQRQIMGCTCSSQAGTLCSKTDVMKKRVGSCIILGCSHSILARS